MPRHRRPIRVAVAKSNLCQHDVGIDVGPSLAQALACIPGVKQRGVAGRYLEARRRNGMVHRHRHHVVTQDLKFLVKFDGVEAEHGGFRAGEDTKIRIQTTVQKILGDELHRVFDGEDVDSFPAGKQSNTQGQQIPHVIEVAVGKNHGADARLLFEG